MKILLSLIVCTGLFTWSKDFIFPSAVVGFKGIESVTDTFEINKSVYYKKQYPFIQYQDNMPEWDDSLALSAFFSALDHASERRVKVLHIGDSHVQADFFTGVLRDKMQALWGFGGRGFVFPYASAGTHGTRDYRTFSYGNWKYAKNIHSAPVFSLGLTGATIYTEDENAGFRFQFREGFLHSDDRVLKLYCDKNERAFDALLIMNNGDTLILDCSLQDNKPYVEIRLPGAPYDFQIRLLKQKEEQQYFQCYGISIENTGSGGILYSSVGINGAAYTSLLRQALMPEQLRDYKPDLVVIDLGANDFYPKLIDKPVFEDNLKNIIRIIRSVRPGVSVLITCSQDIYCRKKNIAECKNFSRIAQNIALEMQCAFYDYYHISGGQYAMNKWLQYKLAKPDKVHLTAEGYLVKGELYFSAMMNAYLHNSRGAKSFRINRDIIPKPSVIPVAETKESELKYKVQSGDNLGRIAQKYSVSISELKSWNHLTSDQIRIGQVLHIYGNKSAPAPNVSSGYYTVQSGDSLWEIARKFNTQVDVLKELNNLGNNAIHPGMNLKLP